MANWFPLIINTGSSQIQELPSGQNLDLSNSNISNVAAITVTNTGTAIVNGAASGSGNIGATGATFNTILLELPLQPMPTWQRNTQLMQTMSRVQWSCLVTHPN